MSKKKGYAEKKTFAIIKKKGEKKYISTENKASIR